MVCYRAGGKAGELELEERRRGENLKLAYLLPWPESK